MVVAVVVLQVSAFSRQSVALRQEHAGCPGRLRQLLGASHGAKSGELPLHWQREGAVELLQVSVVLGQWLSSKHEHSNVASGSP